MGMGRNTKQDKLLQAKVSCMAFQSSVPPIYLLLLLKCREVEQ